MLKDSITYIVLSDIHLGNRRNKTKDICDNIRTMLRSVNSGIDIIFFAGDLFDDLIEFNSEDIHEVILFIDFLTKYCLNKNIKLRILEGTPSHDWRQSKTSELLIKIISDKLDFKYIDTLSIENINDLGINVLYLPDEWNDDAEQTYKEVLELLKNNNLEQVDLAIMHGLFDYQLKEIPKKIKHNESNYLSIVRYFINIGHIHTFSTYERIIAQGSVDRLSHGEEEAKGMVRCKIFNTGEMTYDFIENKNAKIFKTIILKNNDLDKNIKKIEKEIKNLPIDSYISIKAKRDNPIYMSIEQLKLKYPEFNFSRKSIEDHEEEVKSDLLLDSSYKPITINKENITTILLDQINTKYQLNQDKINLLQDIIEVNR